MLPSTLNGFKLMNDESEMMKLILPTVLNSGEKNQANFKAML